MSVSLTLLDNKDRSGRNLWQLNEDFKYKLGPRCYVKVPAGYVTNFGTIPRPFFKWVTPAELREASLVHDWMCNEDLLDDGVEVNSGFTRFIADAVLYEHMRELGIAGWKRLAVYVAVRLYANVKGIK